MLLAALHTNFVPIRRKKIFRKSFSRISIAGHTKTRFFWTAQNELKVILVLFCFFRALTCIYFEFWLKLVFYKKVGLTRKKNHFFVRVLWFFFRLLYIWRALRTCSTINGCIILHFDHLPVNFFRKFPLFWFTLFPNPNVPDWEHPKYTIVPDRGQYRLIDFRSTK